MFRALRRQSTVAYRQCLGQLSKDLQQAMIRGDENHKLALRSILAGVKNSELRGEPKDEWTLHDLLLDMKIDRMGNSCLFVKVYEMELAQREMDQGEVVEQYLHNLPPATREHLYDELEAFFWKLLEEQPHLSLTEVVGSIPAELAEKWSTRPHRLEQMVKLANLMVFEHDWFVILKSWVDEDDEAPGHPHHTDMAYEDFDGDHDGCECCALYREHNQS